MLTPHISLGLPTALTAPLSGPQGAVAHCGGCTGNGRQPGSGEGGSRGLSAHNCG